MSSLPSTTFAKQEKQNNASKAEHLPGVRPPRVKTASLLCYHSLHRILKDLTKTSGTIPSASRNLNRINQCYADKYPHYECHFWTCLDQSRVHVLFQSIERDSAHSVQPEKTVRRWHIPNRCGTRVRSDSLQNATRLWALASQRHYGNSPRAMLAFAVPPAWNHQRHCEGGSLLLSVIASARQDCLAHDRIYDGTLITIMCPVPFA